MEDVWKKRDTYWSGEITARELLKWVLNHLGMRSTIKAYRALLQMEKP